MSRKNMRNPMERVDFENPAGDIVKDRLLEYACRRLLEEHTT